MAPHCGPKPVLSWFNIGIRFRKSFRPPWGRPRKKTTTFLLAAESRVVAPEHKPLRDGAFPLPLPLTINSRSGFIVLLPPNCKQDPSPA